MRYNNISTILFVGLAFFLCFSLAQDESFTNTKILRHIDLTSQLARHTINITAENKGKSSASQYTLALQDKYQTSHLAYLRVIDENGSELKVSTGTPNEKEGYTTYQITLAKPLDPAQSASFSVSLVLVHTQQPFPTHISQTDRQLVRYFDNHYVFSPYTTTTQRTTVKVATKSVIEFSEKSPNKASGDTLTFGAYTDAKPFSHSELRVHFENSSPFITITKLVKEIEISHWGNLAIEQHFDIRHDGATLKGSFSRFDFQRNPGASSAVVTKLVEILPLGASDVYYRDDIGNISSSTFQVSPKGLEFHIVPRFPLFGGWKNSFYTGYNVPLASQLYTEASDSSSFVLNSTFAVDMADVAIDHEVIRIILPEGAKDPRVVVPFHIDAQYTDKHYSYLDTTGRTVLVIEKHNVVREHNQYFQVYYHFSRLSMLQEPLLVAFGLLVFFVSVMAYVRFDVTIKQTEKKVVDIKVSKTISQFKENITRFQKEYKNLQNTYKNIQDPSVFKQERARTLQLYIKAALQDAQNVANSLSKTNPVIYEKLKEVITFENERLKTRIELQDLELEFKAAGSKGKAKYDAEREELQRRYDDAVEGADLLLTELTNYL